MAAYRIYGIANDNCEVYIIQDDEYKGKSSVPAGPYEIIFESTSSGTITAAAENSKGMIINFGRVTPIDIISCDDGV